jgi:protein CpxP
MKPFRSTAIVLAAAMLAAVPAAFAESPPPGHGIDRGAQDGPDAGPGPGDRRGPGGHGLPFLRGVELTEAQQDRLFAILHAQAPQLREQDKIEDKAHAALRAMADAGDYSEAKAVGHAKALGQAIAARELLRVRTGAQVMALLTAEQRAQVRRAPR